jgi:hypothetical protein
MQKWWMSGFTDMLPCIPQIINLDEGIESTHEPDEPFFL